MDHDFASLRVPDGDDALRPLDWSELSARLAAAHQLRRELARVGAAPGAGPASFATRAARALRSLPHAPPGINLEPSANGKAGQGTCGAAMRDRGQR